MGIILLPYTNDTFHFIEEAKGSENRTKLIKPQFNDSLEKYFKDYDSYYTDNFSLRDNFIRLLNQLQFSLFSTSSVPDRVTIGKDGWFYEASCAINYKAANLFTEEELSKYREEIRKRTLWARKRGIHYYLAIVPNKMQIYPEYLPRQVIKTSDVSRYDQVVALNNDSTVNVIDIRKNLLAHKNDGYDLYQHTDDHWNDLGAYYGYQAILNRLSKDFPELKPLPLDDFKISIDERIGNMASILNVEQEHPEHFLKLEEKFQPGGHDGAERGYKTLPQITASEYEIVTENASGKKLKILIIRDSFAMLLMKFMKENFMKCVYIHDQWMYRMREDVIIKEKPDIIINEVLETGLQKLLWNPFKLSVNDSIERSVNILASNGKFVCVESGGALFANRNKCSSWEEFAWVSYGNNECSLLSWKDLFVSSGSEEVWASAEIASDWERLKVIRVDKKTVAFKAFNGKYLSVDQNTSQLFAKADQIGPNEKFQVMVSNKPYYNP
jgi:hypothetical protein